MPNGWTHERKAKQRAAIYRWRPWEKSTGPKTDGGKQTVARNAWKHGHRSQAAKCEWEAIRKMIEEFAQ
jgi:hypothetical protein